jgi:hypothetical protein
VILNALGFVVSIALLRNVKANDPKPPPSNKHPLRDRMASVLSGASRCCARWPGLRACGTCCFTASPRYT